MSKLIRCFLLGTTLLIAMTSTAQQNAHPVPPFKMFDNLYYIGIDWVSAYVLKTSGGLIMIDTLYDNFSDHTIKSIEQLGMNPKDVKYIIVTHGHNDHVGGAKTAQSLTGARLVMAEGDWVMSKLSRDIIVKDGDTIKLGDTMLKLFLTPGHTPGVTSIEFPVFDNGKEYKAFIFGGHGQNFSGVQTTQTYINSVKRVMTLAAGAQVPVTNHPDPFQILQRGEKLAARKPGEANPFVDPDGFTKWLNQLLTNAEKKLEDEKKAGRP
jgi:metallo-beta-lactamase class B